MFFGGSDDCCLNYCITIFFVYLSGCLVGWPLSLDSRSRFSRHKTLLYKQLLTLTHAHTDLIANGFDVLLANISLMSTGGAVIFLPIKIYKESVFGLTLWAARHTKLVRLLLFCVSSSRSLMPNRDKVRVELFFFLFCSSFFSFVASLLLFLECFMSMSLALCGEHVIHTNEVGACHLFGRFSSEMYGKSDAEIDLFDRMHEPKRHPWKLFPNFLIHN